MLSVICNEKLKIKNVKLLGVFVAAFLIFNFTFYIQPVRAQECAPGPNAGIGCTVSDGRTGTINDCGECTNLGCPQTPVAQRFCNGACIPISTIQTDDCQTGAGQEGTWNSCGTTCVANGPRAATRQYGSYPGVSEAGFINISGDFGSGGDMYLNSGRAIRVDNVSGSSVLNLGNYVTGGTEFHATLHAQGTNLAELIFQQGSDDRWALSVRSGATTTPTGGDFEIRRGTTGWPRVLAIDYNTGGVTLYTDVAIGGALNVSGALTVGGAAVLTNVTAPAGSGITVTGTGNTRQVAVSGCAAGEVLKRAAGGATWECAEDAQGVAGITDHGLLEAASLLDNDHPQYYLQTGDTRNLTIGDSLFAYRIFPRVSSLQLGDAESTIDVRGILQVGRFRVPGDIQASPLTAGMLYYKSSSSGGTPTGLYVHNGTGWDAVGGGTTYTAGDYVTIGADNRISATHDGGCFGPVFVGVTPGSTLGQITSGGLAGYRAAHALCNAPGAFPGSHMCAINEVLNSISCGASAGTSEVFTQTLGMRAWIANGAPSLPTQTNDCNGWIFPDPSATVNGVAWEFNGNGGTGWAQTCNSSFPIACCR